MAGRAEFPTSETEGYDSALNTPITRGDSYIRDSYGGAPALSPNVSAPLLNENAAGLQRNTATGAADPMLFDEKQGGRGSRPRRRRWPWVLGGIAALIVIVLAVIIPVYFTVIKPNKNNSSGSSDTSSSPNGPASHQNPGSPTGGTTGGNGTFVIDSANNQTFTYLNEFGGFWYYDPATPFNGSGQAQSYTPLLNQSWTFGVNRIYGVNLGGWFVTEPFIAPTLFEPYLNTTTANGAVQDEWTLSLAMRADTANGGINQLETHYDTFITEQDFAEIAGAGLNWVRVPIPYWAIEVWDGEPFLERVAWKYIVRMLGWARKYGIRVNLDLHTVPGSQNGYNHSGKSGLINFMNGAMGFANAQRTVNYIRIITEFISQPEYSDIVQMFSILNEPLAGIIGIPQMTNFYLLMHDTIRAITGVGAGHGPYVVLSDGFQGGWPNFLHGSDRLVLDSHPYLAFGGGPVNPNLTALPETICVAWGSSQNLSQVQFGVSIAGEWSTGVNNCGYFLNGVQGDQAQYTGACANWTDSTTWDQPTIQSLLAFTIAQMDALQDSFYWTWKIGNSSVTNSVRSPLWSYSLGLQGGWVPKNPQDSHGACLLTGAPYVPFNGTYQPYMTGGAGAGTIDPTSVSSYSAWPPSTISNLPTGANYAFLPTYTSTGTVATLPPTTITVVGGTSTIPAGNGWADASDTASAPTTVAGCSYPDAWGLSPLTYPTAACTGGAAKRDALPEPVMTAVV